MFGTRSFGSATGTGDTGFRSAGPTATGFPGYAAHTVTPTGSTPSAATGPPIPASEVPPTLRGPEKPEAEEEKKKTLLGISGGQVVAGALAASTSAVAASYLGVAGTVLGAGLGSVIATVSTAVYQKSIQRSSKVLQTVVTTTVGGQQVQVDEVLHEGRDSASVAPDPHLPSATQVGRGLPDPYLAEAHGSGTHDPDPHAADQHASAPYPSDPGAAAAGLGHPGAAASYTVGSSSSDPRRGETQVMGAVPDDATRPFGAPLAGAAATGGARPGYGAATVPPPTRPPGDGTVYGGGPSWYDGLPWKRIAMTSAAVFVLVMGLITTAEIIEGRTVADAVKGEQGTGTTLTHVTGNSKKDPDPTPSVSPSASESDSESPTPTDSPSTDPTPSGEGSESAPGEPSNSPDPTQTDGSSDESPQPLAPPATQGAEQSESAPAEPMDGSVSTVPSASPLG